MRSAFYRADWTEWLPLRIMFRGVTDRTMAMHTIDWREFPPAECRGGILSIGNFDGVHRGHAALIAALRTQRLHRRPGVVLTFDPHPLSLLRPRPGLLPLTTLTDRADLLGRAARIRS